MSVEENIKWAESIIARIDGRTQYVSLGFEGIGIGRLKDSLHAYIHLQNDIQKALKPAQKGVPGGR